MKKLPYYDYYRKLASQIFNVSYEKVTEEQKSQAQRMNWFRMYSNDLGDKK